MTISALIKRDISSVKKQMKRMSIIIGNTVQDVINDRVLFKTHYRQLKNNIRMQCNYLQSTKRQEKSAVSFVSASRTRLFSSTNIYSKQQSAVC